MSDPALRPVASFATLIRVSINSKLFQLKTKKSTLSPHRLSVPKRQLNES